MITRRTGFSRSPIDPKTGNLRFSTFKKPAAAKALERTAFPQKRAKSLERAPMKRKRRKPKPGDDPAYKAFIKTQPCVVCGSDEVDPHHIINGKGDARKGMGQTVPDRFLLPACRQHHEEFHHRRGFCAGWDDARRLTFQEQEVERLREIWRDLNELGVVQEPQKRAI